MFSISIFGLLGLVSAISCASVRMNKNVGIINGHKVTIKDAPYMVSVQNSEWDAPENFTHSCGGTIIHERFIVSAAHCIITKNEEEYKIAVGTDQIDGDSDKYDVEKIIVHEKYNSAKYDYDISLLKVDRPIVFGENVQPISLTPGLKMEEGMYFEATGWGDTEPAGNLSQELLQVSMPMIPVKLCKQIYKTVEATITPRMLCAGELGRDTCQGDSGGPLTYKNTHLVGITSFGQNCGIYPGIYSNVANLLPWIIENIDDNL